MTTKCQFVFRIQNILFGPHAMNGFQLHLQITAISMIYSTHIPRFTCALLLIRFLVAFAFFPFFFVASQMQAIYSREGKNQLHDFFDFTLCGFDFSTCSAISHRFSVFPVHLQVKCAMWLSTVSQKFQFWKWVLTIRDMHTNENLGYDWMSNGKSRKIYTQPLNGAKLMDWNTQERAWHCVL